MRPDPDFWRGKRVLLTGHTGFKGAWLALWLQRLGAQVTGVALPPATEPNLFTLAQVEQGVETHFCDIRNAQAQALALRVRAARPEVVLHLAAQALVRPGYAAPLDTFATNVMGTAHLLDALRGLPEVRVAVGRRSVGVVEASPLAQRMGWLAVEFGGSSAPTILSLSLMSSGPSLVERLSAPPRVLRMCSSPSCT